MSDLDLVIEDWRRGSVTVSDVFYFFVKEVELKPVDEAFQKVPIELRSEIRDKALSWHHGAIFVFSGANAEEIAPDVLIRMKTYFS